MTFIIIAIIWGCIWGAATNVVIQNKGYDENWFWWGFFFGFIALLVAMSKPDNNSKNYLVPTHLTESSTHLTQSAKSIVPKDGWKCIKCGRGNSSYVGTCACGNTKLSNNNYSNNNNLNNKNSNNKPMAPAVPISSADEIAKFKRLLDDGVITQEEFEKKKKQLLGL